MIIKNHGSVIGEITPTSEGLWYRSAINLTEWGFASNRAQAKAILMEIANSSQPR